MAAAGREQGFTLVEIIVILALLGIFAAVALPGFSSLLAGNRTQSVGNELVALLQFTRGHAVENRMPTLLCVAADGVSVRTGCGADGDTLRVLAGSDKVSISAEVDGLQFRSSGMASEAASYTVCADGDFANGFTIEVAASGQIRLHPRGRNGAGAMTTCELAVEVDDDDDDGESGEP
jgi:type IV fimbrial biogenesis protein FimU